ncbi:hypothetical protein pb186bvf_004628 [Paramecium bursaria]
MFQFSSRFQNLHPNSDISEFIEFLDSQQQQLLKQINLEQFKIVESPLKFVDQQDILRDLIGLTEVEQQYLHYLEQRETVVEEYQMSKMPPSARNLLSKSCQICNESADDKVETCSKCNIQVHKKCYGHIEDLTCLLCLNFGSQGRLMICPLCTRRGGAMKPTIQMKDSIFENLNPSFHEYALTHKLDRQKLPEKQETYDFQQVQYQNHEKDEPPKSEKIWCHVICLKLFDNDIMKIDKRKFNSMCCICKTKKTGACVPCAKGKCPQQFHPECARRAQILFQNQVYCPKHQPLKLRSVLDNKHASMIEEIRQYHKYLEKVEVPPTKMISLETHLHKEEMKQTQQSIEQDIKAENEALLQKVQEQIEMDEKFYVIIEKNQVIRINLPQQRSLYEIAADDTIWKYIADENLNENQIYVLYQRAVRMRKKIKPQIIVQLEELPARKRKSIYGKSKYQGRKKQHCICQGQANDDMMCKYINFNQNVKCAKNGTIQNVWDLLIQQRRRPPLYSIALNVKLNQRDNNRLPTDIGICFQILHSGIQEPMIQGIQKKEIIDNYPNDLSIYEFILNQIKQ